MMVQPGVSSFQRTGSVLSFVLLLSLSACKHDDDSLFPEVQQCLKGIILQASRFLYSVL
ncbi:uncharacterized protein BDW70DRAFT_138871 [Aspergillus foveolatus]|uniref:uncharacterized protein n=1 Tax=Aspergillus foveolatus TaxID=210207 RepID=UPI003CCD3AB8